MDVADIEAEDYAAGGGSDMCCYAFSHFFSASETLLLRSFDDNEIAGAPSPFRSLLYNYCGTNRA